MSICNELSNSSEPPVTSRLHLLVLQHPQENRVEVGTVPLLKQMLPQASVRVGLSWRNLPIAAAELNLDQVGPLREWVVLYLGSARPPAERKGSQDDAQQPEKALPLLTFVDRKGEPLSAAPSLEQIRGLVVLDGTWSQAKSLWWRNAWLLKLQRAVVNAPGPSLYNRIRREPRKEAICTLEAVAYALAHIEKCPELAETLITPLRDLA